MTLADVFPDSGKIRGGAALAPAWIKDPTRAERLDQTEEAPWHRCLVGTQPPSTRRYAASSWSGGSWIGPGSFSSGPFSFRPSSSISFAGTSPVFLHFG